MNEGEEEIRERMRLVYRRYGRNEIVRDTVGRKEKKRRKG